MIQNLYLTESEKDVFKELLSGATNIEISDKFITSKHTAKAHVTNIIRKLGAKNRTDAVVKGLSLILGYDYNLFKDDIDKRIDEFLSKK